MLCQSVDNHSMMSVQKFLWLRFSVPYVGRAGCSTAKMSLLGGGGYRHCIAASRRHLRVSAYCPSNSDDTRRDIVSPSVSQRGNKLAVCWGDGHESTFHVTWLRHNCQCPSCLSSSGQKLLQAKDLPAKMTLTSSVVSGKQLELGFSGTPDGHHHGHISLELLRRSCYSHAAIAHRRQQSVPTTASSLPQVDGTNVLEDDKVLWNWLKNLNEYGLCLLTNIPTNSWQIKTVSERIGPVPRTIYPEVFDVKSEEDPVNIAYTTLSLDFHMDLVYYESPPGLQLLHCIRFDSCVEGGESVLLDTYPVLEEMRRKHPEHFATLARVPATFQKIHYERPEPVEMTYQRPHIVLDSAGRIIGVNWSPTFEGPLCIPEEDVEPYYSAYRYLAEMLETSDLKISHRLQPGEVITFNNRRLLHGRNPFQLNGGIRHLQGSYVNIDEFKSRFQVLSSKFGEAGDPVRHVFNQDLL